MNDSAMFNDLSSVADYLATRRSGKPRDMIAPGPDDMTLGRILQTAMRTPDHGKLFPWRLVVMGPSSRAALAKALAPLATRQTGPDKAAKVLTKLTAAPTSILVISSPVESATVPLWEQQLSAGAVCMNIEPAAGALGYASSWITDWYSYDAEALTLLGLRTGERVAGFIHIGTAVEPLLERPRPDVASITTYAD